MTRVRQAWLTRRALLFGLALTACAGDGSQARHLVLATTTSLGNSGLLDALLPSFQREHGLQIRSHLVGSGLALRMLEKGYADVAISHAPTAEALMLRTHPQWRYRKIMFNEFVIVGPPEDPARAKSTSNAATAMRRIADSSARFLSRGDRSGTHEREQQLWRLAGARPGPDRLIVAGAGMGATLRIASETGAYTLTDRATFAHFADTLRVVIVSQDRAMLLNTYAVVTDPSVP